ncbi:MAG: glycoside hydrolase family 3 C-terminal domain-containing protein [Clostridiales bacterium]|nr:glycoside hydrolase family 3 C-terminal domain-containing protein [Clostridiales bacterium]
MDKKSIIEQMTLRQKADFLTGKNFWETKDYPEYGIPSLFLSDGPHGLRRQAAKADHLGLNKSIPATCFPTAATMANSWNEQLGEEMGKALGEEAAAQNVNVLLGPGTCMKRNPRCGRNFEYFSEDPYLAGKMAASYIRGIQSNGTSACVKHYAANNQEERRMVTDSVMDERTLREIYLTAFEIAVKEGKTHAVMSSYNMINGQFADENIHTLREILRGEWGYDGVVMSDWAGTNNKVMSTIAGSDLEMPGCRYGADDVVKAVESGELDISYVDECVERILTLIERTTEGEKGKPFDVEAHHELARKCAEESIVLLQNNGVLPLKKEASVAIIGDFAKTPRYQGAGSSVVNPTKLETPLGSLGKLNCIAYQKGFDRYGKTSKGLINKAVKLAKQADVVLLYLGLDEISEAEGLDREHIKIPSNQIALYKAVRAASKQVVVVLSCGSSVELDWCADADALVYGCLSGQAGASAVMNVITGKVNPSGKLAETFPVRYEDCSSASHFPGKQMTVEYREGLYVGYRYYDTVNMPVTYPFGYGLSYTTFEYSDIVVDDNGVQFTVTNTGERDGAEIAQLYVGMKDGQVFRPTKELKGFKKVYLAKGESKSVRIDFDDKTFRYFNVNTNNWEVEGGVYQLYIGASIADIRLEGSVERAATTQDIPYDKSQLPSYYSGNVANVSDEEFTTLLGREIPPSGYNFYKKNRMVIHENCTVADLRYSKRWIGRFFAGLIRFAIGVLRITGGRTNANTLVMGVLHQPVRGLAKFGNMSRRQMEALLLMFNGHFFKGVGMFFSKEKKTKGEQK